MSTLYLVRHGENPANLTKQFAYKIVNYPLTKKGIVQAQQTAEYFYARPITAIYASPLLRARQTAEIIAKRLGLKITLLDDFMELNIGSLEQMPPTIESWAIYHDVVTAWRSGQHDLAFPAGESYKQLHARVTRGLFQVLENHPEQHVIIVAHGGVFTEMISSICHNVNMAEIAQKDNHNCSITEIEAQVEHGNLIGTLRVWAGYDHLSGTAAQVIPGIPAPGAAIVSSVLNDD